MRKAFVAIALAGLVAAIPGPASAGKTKTIKEEVTFTAPVPAPIYTEVSPDGCLWEGSIEDASKDTYSFTAPKHRGQGTLSFRLEWPEGDWDLYVLKEGAVVAESTADDSVQYEQISVKLPSASTVDIVACNWQSTSPSADGFLSYKYKK